MMKDKIQQTKKLHEAQTGSCVLEDIGTSILEGFAIKENILAISVKNAANMDVVVSRNNLDELINSRLLW